MADQLSRDEKSRLRNDEVTRRKFIGGTAALVAGGIVSSHVRPAFALLSQGSTELTDASGAALLRASDAIKPGQLFSLNGEGLNVAGLQILIAPAMGDPGATPPLHALTAPIVQTDEGGHFVVVRLPEQLASGIFYAWARNATECGAPIVINQPRPLFLSEYEAWAGQQIKIIGRNFDPAEYGGEGAPLVRLISDGGHHHEAEVLSHNPFAIAIKVPHVETTSYSVEISINGAPWVRLAEERLTVVSIGKDPLGLGVAWADHFKWNQIFNVTQYGVPTTGAVDVTAKVQAVVSAAKANGGGVVYFPAGEYELSGIALPADIVILGAGRDKTKLISTTVGGTFINTSGDGNIYGRQGVADLRIELKNPDVRPDTFIWLGEPWGQNNNTNDLRARTASEFFVKEVDLNYGLTPPTVTSGQRGLGLEWIGKERAICVDCHFVGYHAQPYINYITNYCTLANNHFEYSTGLIVDNGSRCFYENNHIVGRREYGRSSDDLHGLFARDRAYMANNVVEGVGSLGDNNDGEALCVEVPGANFNYGSVTDATLTTLTVNPEVPLTAPLLYFGYLAVLIVDGRGLGQMRRVATVDSASNQLTVSSPWNIIPDTTSAFTLIAPLDQVTFYQNSITDCWKGLWFFGNTYDSVQAENVSSGSEGIFMYTVRTSGGNFVPGYFARFARNKIAGISSKSQHGGIDYNTGRFDRDGSYFGTMAYGIEMIENFISGNPGAAPIGATESTPASGLTCSAASYSSEYDGSPVGADGKNTIMLRNQLTELSAAVNLTHSIYGTILAENTYTPTVGTFLNDTGSVETLQIDNRKQATVV